MDAETRVILQKTIEDWCQDQQSSIAELESYPTTAIFSTTLFDQLNQLGLLHILFEQSHCAELNLVAEAAYHFARYSPSIALLVVQQNMASCLLAQTGGDEPNGWVALPLYDAPTEWPYQIESRSHNEINTLHGLWHSVPLLPVAESLLLPVCNKLDGTFRLVRIDLRANDAHLERSHAALTLGLRGCPLGDLALSDYPISEAQVIANSADDLQKITRLWSQAEVWMMAIRSGIFERCYQIALDYAQARWQGGKVIVQHSLIRQMLAELYQEKCALFESWQTIAQTMDPAAKLSDGQMGLALNSAQRLPWATSEGIQLLGGIGYMEDFAQERSFRDAKQCESLLGHLQARKFATWQSQLE